MTLIQKMGNCVTTAYMVLLFGIYPLYMQDGYRDIGTAKYNFLFYISLGAFAILGLLGVLQAIRMIWEHIENKEAYLIDWDRLSVTDLFVIMYATEILISAVLSEYRQEALWGTEGWYMGLILRLVFCGLYFLVSRFYRNETVIWYVAGIAATVVCLLGILDRFSIYLIPLEIRSAEFISTLGNINWFCGYLSVLLPAVSALFLLEENTGKKLFFGGCIVLLFMAGFAQGSSSIFLIFGGLFFLLLWVAVYKQKRLADWFLLMTIWGTAAQLVRLLRGLLPDGYNYESNTLCAKMTDSGLTIPAIVIGIGGFFLLNHVGKERSADNGKIVRIVHTLAAGGLIVGILIWLFLSVFHTFMGIPPLEGNSSFLFNAHWGNGRGATWWTGLQIFKKQTFLHKLVGVGPDCFAACAYSLPDVASYLREYFDGSRLTNAHNEFLTELVNTGVTGAALYAGIFFSSFFRCMQESIRQIQQDKNSDFWLCPFMAGIGCYLLHNLVSFAQVLNFPLVILMIAMGEGLMRCRNLSARGGNQIRQAAIDE